MTDHQQPVTAFEAFGTWLRQDPEFEEAKRRLWAMTPAKRVQAMRAGQLSLRLCLHWASRAPQEVPLLDGEWWFIAVDTPELADAPDPLAAAADGRQP
jgi:hypothetical protein